MPKWVQLEPNQIRYLNQQVEAIKLARGWRDRDLAQAFGVNVKAVQNYAGRQPTPKRIKAETLKRIAVYAENPDQFAQVLDLPKEEPEPLVKSQQQMQAEIDSLREEVDRLRRIIEFRFPEAMAESLFRDRILAHMKSMGEDLMSVAAQTRIPVDRLQEILNNNGGDIQPRELSALGIYIGNSRELEQLLNLPAPSQVQQPQQHYENGNSSARITG
jgi:transcriptional regulator with XRE-family HTH domain